MKNIEEIVINCYKNVLEERGINIAPTLDTEITREFGLDSLGLVNLLVEIEDNLDVELDEILVKIRKSHSLKEIVDAIKEKIVNKI